MARRSWSSVVVGCVVLGLVVAAPASGFESGETTARYIGLDGNWFNPRNWSTGQVPGPATNVVLDGFDNVVIDPGRGGARVTIADLTVTDWARLTTLPRTVLSTRNERVGGSASVLHQSTESRGERFEFSDLCLDCTLDLNPTPKSRRIVILTSNVTGSVLPSTTVQFGLGGTAPAGPGRVGPGHYATITAEHVELGGRLSLATHYGFTPVPGDTFQIVTGKAVAGQFDNAGEGDVVAAWEDLVVTITYRGGDGNDVVLTALPLRPPPPRLPPDPPQPS